MDRRTLLKMLSCFLQLVTEHSLDCVAHVFPVGSTEMNHHSVGGLTDFLHQWEPFLSLRSKRIAFLVAAILTVFSVLINSSYLHVLTNSAGCPSRQL